MYLQKWYIMNEEKVFTWFLQTLPICIWNSDIILKDVNCLIDPIVAINSVTAMNIYGHIPLNFVKIAFRCSITTALICDGVKAA